MVKNTDQYSDKEGNTGDSVAGLKQHIKMLESHLGDLMKAEDKLRESEENYRDIFETAEEGIAYGTLRGKVLAINRNLEKILEIPREEIVGRNVMRLAGELLTRENSDIVVPLLQGLLRGRPVPRFAVRYRDKILEVSININTNTKRLTGILRDVTENHRIQDELRISEQRLRRAELASRSGNWELHLKTGTMIGSEGAMKLYGVSSNSALYSEMKKIPLAEYRPMMDKAINDLINLGKPYDIEFKIKKADTGEIIDIHSICEYDRENQILFGSIQDITDRKKAESVIMRNNRDLAQLVQISMDLLETVDRKEIFKRILEGAVRLTGLDTGAIYFINGDDLHLEVSVPSIPDNYPDEFRKADINKHLHIKRAVTSQTPVIVRNIYSEEITPEERMIADNRDLHSMIYIPLIVNKQSTGILILGTISRIYDFSDREIRLSRTLSNIASLTIENSLLFDNLVVAKEKAEESDRLKTSFLHNVSHEIRTPLNAIIGFSAFLNQPDLSEEERQGYIDIIFQSNNQLLNIINDILNISHIETGQVKLKIAPVNINKIIRSLQRQFLPEAEKKNIELRIKTAVADSDANFDTDGGKLLQILSNLLSNAIKFTEKGYAEIGYECRHDHVEFFVADTGVGIAGQEHSRIFERFYQVDKAETRNYGGTGLGLPISMGYVELLGGKIWLESKVGEGSVFFFTVPCSGIYNIEPVADAAAAERPVKPSHTRSILVAEDEESNFALIDAMLKQKNYKILRAKNGQEAVDLFKKNRSTDLILMDIKMPVKDGFEAASEILSIKPNVPIIAQSAYAHQSDRALAIEIGFVDYLNKPFDKGQLLDIVEKYIK